MEILTMGNTVRHMTLLDWITIYAVNKKQKDHNFSYGREQIALVENHGALIDIESLNHDQVKKVRDNISKLKFTYPDFMIFKNNPIIINDKKTRYAGTPDLIIEIWSDANLEKDREEKRNLYRTNKSEFWEFEQDSPKVICWNKDGKVYEQLMDKPIITPWGDEIDLVELSHDVMDKLPNDRFNGGLNIGIDIDL